MKKIVFLCLLLVMAMGRSVGAKEEELEFDYSDGSFNIEHRDFTITLDTSEYRYFVNGVEQEDGYYLVFGYLDKFKSDTLDARYDGFMLLISRHGDVIEEVHLHTEYLGEVTHAGFMDGTLYAVHTISTYTGEPYTFKENNILYFDYTLDVLKETVLDSPVTKTYPTKEVLYISQDYAVGYNLALDKDGKWLDEGLHSVENYGVYVGDVTLLFTGEAVFDYARIETGKVISYPGDYHLLYKGQFYYFTVDFDFQHLFDGHTLLEPFALEYDVGQVFINDAPYASGELIDQPGRYRLTAKGMNDYEKSIEISLTSNLEGVYDGLTYENERTLTFLGEGYLNNHPIESGTTVVDVGTYTLEIFGEGDYREVVHFSISHDSNVNNFNGWIGLEIGLFSVGVLLALYTVYAWKKKR